MEQQIVPTSPKSPERQARAQSPDQSSHWFIRFCRSLFMLCMMIIVTVVVLCAVVLAPTDWPIFGPLHERLVSGQPTEMRTAVTLPADVMADQSIMLQTVRPLYSVAPTLTSSATLLGNAVALTHDGWMVAPSSLFTAPKKNPTSSKASTPSDVRVTTPRQPVVLLADGTVGVIRQTIPDPISGLTFFQIDGNLPMVVELLPAATAIDQTWLSIVQTTQTGHTVFGQHLAGVEGAQLVHSTTRLSQWQVIGSTDAASIAGAAVFSDATTCAGLIDADRHIIPAGIISGALESIMESGVIKRSTVDVDYAFVSQLTATEREEKKIPDHGLLIIDNHQLDSTNPPAADQTVLPGDVIILINNQFVDQDTDLATIIHSVPTGTILYLTVVRDGKDTPVQWSL